jgi:hypothetical protein
MFYINGKLFIHRKQTDITISKLQKVWYLKFHCSCSGAGQTNYKPTRVGEAFRFIAVLELANDGVEF